MILRRRRALSRALALACACFLAIAGAVATAGASHGTTTTAQFSATKTISRINLINGHDQVAEQHQFSLSVDKTTDLRNEEQVQVSWSGAHPTAGIANDPNSAAATGQEYPMVLLECRGQDGAPTAGVTQLSPQTCWTISSEERYADDSNTQFPAWRLDRYETPANRAEIVGEPSPLPKGCSPAETDDAGHVIEARRYVHFIAADGTDYPYGQSGCAGAPPEATDYSTSIVPSNETYAVTGTDGTGTSTFDVWTTEENASLGCKQGVACAIVAVPILGISCDPDAASLPAADRPAAGAQHDDAAAACEANGNIAPGGAAGGNNKPAATVTGAYWWSQSNWRNRISVPLQFAAPSNICDVVSSAAPVDIYGSELMTEAMAQWSPYFCLTPGLFPVKHVQTGEPQAVNLLNSNNVEAAFDNQPPPTGYATTTVNAPAALTGFAVTYQVDGTNGKPYANLKLTPRLLAKLLTESYSIGNYLAGDFPYLVQNPLNLAEDPEFQALNPGAPTSIDYQVASTILFASDDSDLMTDLTAYINADPEARAWLNGAPDPWGMTVNPAYKNISLPVSSWPLLDTTVRKDADPASDPCNYYNPVPFLPQVQSPLVRYSLVTQHMQFANPNDQIICNINQNNPQQSKLGPEPRQTPGHRFMIGFTTLADAVRYGIPVAQLETNTSAQAPVKFTDSTGRTFAGATTQAIAAAGQQLSFDSSTGVWDLDYNALRSNPANAGAYPGTMIVYTSVPTSGLPSADANDYATFLRFTAGIGQVSGPGTGQLAAGYVPLTAADGLGALAAYTNAAADDVAAQAGGLPGQSTGNATSAGATSAPTTSTGTGHTSSSATHHTAAATPAPAATIGGDAAGSIPAPVVSSGSNPAPKVAVTLGSPTQAAPALAASVGRTTGTASGAAGWLFPLLLGVALLSGLASFGLRTAGRLA